MTPLALVFELAPAPAAQRHDAPRESAWVVVTLALIAASVWLASWLRRWLDRRARVRRAARAQAAERDALGVLEAAGFRVIGRQARQSWSVLADGEEVRFTLIADYLVEREGKRWVAEVKTGERGLDLRHGPTRRQLLEYREAFGADGVLLVDAERRGLRSVRFHGAPAAARSGAGRWLAMGLALGVSIGIGIGWLLVPGLARRAPLPSAAAPAAPARLGDGGAPVRSQRP